MLTSLLSDTLVCSLPGSSVHRNSLSKNTGMGCYDLLMRISLTQGLNPCVWFFATPWTVAFQAPLSMEFSIDMPSSRGSSQPRDRTQVSRIADRFFTIGATRETRSIDQSLLKKWLFQPFPTASGLEDYCTKNLSLPNDTTFKELREISENCLMV